MFKVVIFFNVNTRADSQIEILFKILSVSTNMDAQLKHLVQ